MPRTMRTRRMVETFLRAAVIGCCGGLASLGFRWATNAVQELVGIGANILQGARELEWWATLAIPVGGALFAALVVLFLVRSSEGTGLTDVMEAVSVRRGPIRLRSALLRSLASLGIIASGGSVGREGPIITISSAAASALTKLLRAPMRDRGLLLGCGVAAGFASAYHAPIAGAIFAMEVVLGNFAMEIFGPVVVASVSSMLFTQYLASGDAIYKMPSEQFKLMSAMEVGPYLVLGVLAGFVAVGFQWMLGHSGKWFEAIKLPRVATMMLGGLAIGAIALLFPEVWGNGYESVSELLRKEGERFGDAALEGSSLWRLGGIMLVLLVIKTVGTAITVGSGGAGGVFTPTLFVGATLGGAFGVAMNLLAPDHVGPYEWYAVVGMGCLVAGTTRAPIMAIVVIFEMTMTYEIVLPLMLGCITASLVARRLTPHSIYEERLAERGTLLPEGIEETVLVTTRVSDIMRTDSTWVTPSMTYAEIVPLVTATRASVVFVCEEGMELKGVIRLHDVIELASMGDLGPGIIAADMMVPVDPVTADQALATVFEAYEQFGIGELPVVQDREKRRLVGRVTRRDVMSSLHLEILKSQKLRAKFVHREESQERADYVELPKGSELTRVPCHPDHVDRTMAEARIRARHEVMVVTVIRKNPDGGEMRIIPDGDFVLRRGDDLIVIGPQQALQRWKDECGE